MERKEVLLKLGRRNFAACTGTNRNFPSVNFFHFSLHCVKLYINTMHAVTSQVKYLQSKYACSMQHICTTAN